MQLPRFILIALVVALVAFGGTASAGSTAAAPGQSAPVNVSLPSVNGTASSGQTLSASAGTWNGPNIAYSFGWQRCNTSGGACATAGGSGTTYTLSNGDVGATIRVMVTASNKNGSTVATSSPSAVVAGPPAPQTTTTTTTTTTPTTTTTATTTTATTTTSSSTGFTTSLTGGMTITPSYTWTFDPGVATSAGQFWADGVKLASISGPGPYKFTIASGLLTSGSHTLGHSWDTTSGAHQAPPASYGVTVNNPTTTTTTTTTTITATPTGTIKLDGRASLMSTLYSTTATNQGQSPAKFWDCLCFLNNDIQLVSDARYGKAYSVRVGTGSTNPWYNVGPLAASAETTKIRSSRLGQWDWYANAVRIEPGFTAPDWATVQQLNYPSLSSPPAALDMKKVNGVFSWTFYRNAGLLTANAGGFYQGPAFEEPTLMPVEVGKWTEFIIGIKWATDNTGEVRVYTRVPADGETGFTLRLTRSNTPTWQYGNTPSGNVRADGTDVSTGQPHSTLDKEGLYFGYYSMPSTFPTNSVSARGMVVASDMATAQASLP